MKIINCKSKKCDFLLNLTIFRWICPLIYWIFAFIDFEPHLPILWKSCRSKRMLAIKRAVFYLWDNNFKPFSKILYFIFLEFWVDQVSTQNSKNKMYSVYVAQVNIMHVNNIKLGSFRNLSVTHYCMWIMFQNKRSDSKIKVWNVVLLFSRS